MERTAAREAFGRRGGAADGVRRQSVGEWLRRFGGRDVALKRAAGKTTEAASEQLRRVEKQLERGPQVMRSRKWTVRRWELIERECGCGIVRPELGVLRGMVEVEGGGRDGRGPL